MARKIVASAIAMQGDTPYMRAMSSRVFLLAKDDQFYLLTRQTLYIRVM